MPLIVDDAALVWVVHDTNPHALSPKVKKFVQAQHWFQDLTHDRAGVSAGVLSVDSAIARAVILREMRDGFSTQRRLRAQLSQRSGCWVTPLARRDDD